MNIVKNVEDSSLGKNWWLLRKVISIVKYAGLDLQVNPLLTTFLTKNPMLCT